MDYDLIIIGAGWAGFNAAIRARELGLKAVLIENREVGGACLNRGCIPTKALIQSAKIYGLCKKAKTFGISVNEPQLNFSEAQVRKDKVVSQLRAGMEFMLKGTDVLRGTARILDAHTVDLGAKKIIAKFILIAAGSKPVELKAIKFDGKKIISSDDILNLKEIPQSLLIIGGGVIGCEFAGLFSAFGSQITIVEKMPQLLPGEDKEVARKLENTFKKKGMKISTDTDAGTIDFNHYALALLSVGRAPSIENLGLENAGINLERGRIVIDNYLRTSIPNIYAAGDCTGKVLLAHFAGHQGRVAAENIASGGNNLKAAPAENIPSCIFTDPEIAGIGMNEESAQAKGIEITINRFDFMGSGMARILDEADGFMKIISDKKTGQLLGASIIGPKATELIGVLTLPVQLGLGIHQLKDIVLAHPTLSESIGDCLRGSKTH